MSSDAKIEQLPAFFQEAGNQALAILDTDGDGVVNLQTEAPGLQQLYADTNLTPDLDSSGDLNQAELAIMFHSMSGVREGGEPDRLETSAFDDSSQLNWRINQSTLYGKPAEGVEGSLSTDMLDYIDGGEFISPEPPVDPAAFGETLERVLQEKHPDVTEEQWEEILDQRFPEEDYGIPEESSESVALETQTTFPIAR
ncbi:MAG: hypothetical protein SFZ03_04635 [Candidatus Melainabacteria bacterium]|nr:hypothetical protein [Candidatus Melainabacteria bacterium]